MKEERVLKSIDDLTGTEKVAIFMLMLEQEQVAMILEKMNEEEVRSISNSIANLGVIDRKIANTVLHQFFDHLNKISSVIGSLPIAQRILYDALPKSRASLLMETMSGNKGASLWERLNNITDVALANYLEHENPQAVAMILSKLRVSKSAAVLKIMPKNVVIEVIIRMVNINNVNADVVDSIEETLLNDFMQQYDRSTIEDPYQTAANIFNYLDRETESVLFEGLNHYNSHIAEKIKSMMFTFEDLYRIGTDGLQTLLAHVDMQQIAIALKGAPENTREWFFNSISHRAAKILKEELSMLGAIKLRSVDEAQSMIVNKAREMIDDNEIILDERAK